MANIEEYVSSDDEVYKYEPETAPGVCACPDCQEHATVEFVLNWTFYDFDSREEVPCTDTVWYCPGHAPDADIWSRVSERITAEKPVIKNDPPREVLYRVLAKLFVE